MRSRAFRICTALAALISLSCGSDDERLVPESDSEFTELEAPEAAGECDQASDSDVGCEHTCVHSCVAAEAGPSTCPAEPTAIPERLAGAECACVASRCIWQ